MPIAPALLALQALPELIKFGTAFAQKKQAKGLEGVARPNYQIPDEYKRRLNQATMMAGATDPFGQTRRDISRSDANALNAISRTGQSAASQIAGIAGVNAQTNQQLAQLGERSNIVQENRMNSLYQAESAMGQQKLEQQQRNLWDPYMQTKAAESAYREAAIRNFQTGLEGLSDTAITGFMLKDQRPDLFGTGNRAAKLTGSTTPTFQGATQATLPPQGGYSVSPYEDPSMEQMYPTQSPSINLGGANPMAADYFSQISAGNNVNSLNAFGANAPNNYMQGAAPSQGGSPAMNQMYPMQSATMNLEQMANWGGGDAMSNDYFSGLSGDETYNNPLIGNNVSQKSARNYNLDNIFGQAARNLSNYLGYLKMRRYNGQ